MNEFIQNDKSTKSKYRLLLDLIPVGEENAVSMKTLASVLDITERALRKVIESARKNGQIIASGDAGYFVPANGEELLHFYNRSMCRIKTNSRSLNAVRRKLKETGLISSVSRRKADSHSARAVKEKAKEAE